MSPLRYLFPSFEKPVAQRQHLQLESPRRRFGGIGAVLALSAVCGGIFLALPDTTPGQRTKPPRFLVAAPVQSQRAPVDTSAASTTASAAEDGADLSLMKLSILCGDKPTARRICAEAKAARDAKLAEIAARKKAKARAEQMAAMAAKIAAEAVAEANGTQTAADDASSQQQKAAHVADKQPAGQLVHVYDQIAPDGQRVPVYRRSSDGRYVFGAPEPAPPPDRRAELQQPRGFLSFLFGN
jgi:hypothetical protein